MNEPDKNTEPATASAVDAIVMPSDVIRGKVLVCGHVVVDATMIDCGIYATSKPHIYYNNELTIESLIKVYETGLLTKNNDMVIENIKKCRLVDVEIHIRA